MVAQGKRQAFDLDLPVGSGLGLGRHSPLGLMIVVIYLRF
jgi:hypothetical protein